MNYEKSYDPLDYNLMVKMTKYRGNKKKKVETNYFADYPYISYIMRYSGFLPLKCDATDNNQLLSGILIIVSALFFFINIVSVAASAIEISHEIQFSEGTLMLVFQAVHLTFLLQGIANQALMTLTAKKMEAVLKSVRYACRKFNLTANSRKGLITSLVCLLFTFLFTILTLDINCRMTVNIGMHSSCNAEVYAFLPAGYVNSTTLYSVIAAMQCFSIPHSFIISLFADYWILSVSRTMQKSIQKLKTELILMKNKKDFDFIERFETWNAYYNQLHTFCKHISCEFSFLLCINIASNPVLLCLSLYWAILQTREDDKFQMILPFLLTVLQFLRLTILSSDGSQFQIEVNSLLITAQKIDPSDLKTSMRYQLKTIFIREGIDPVVLSAGQFFTISKNLLLSILGAVLTTVVVFVQMAPSDSAC